MGKAKEIAELGDKITVSGGTVTVADISTSTFSGTSIHSMQDVDLTGIAHNMFLKYNLSNTRFEVVAGNTSSIDEGTNLYYTDARVASYLSSNDFDTATNIVASITDSAPGTLDTLNELAAALGDDANFSTTVTNSIATKLPLSGGTMTGVISGFESTGIDDNASATAITILSDGNVGIGDNNPDNKLVVKDGNIKLKSNADGNTGILRLYDAAGAQSGQVYPSAGDLRIWSPNDVLILPTGNIGIGTTSPLATLDSAGIIRQTRDIVSNSVFKSFTIGSNRTVDDYGGLNKEYWAIQLQTPGPSTSGESAHHAYGSLKFSGVSTSDTTLDDVLVLKHNGYVGIGTNNPQAKLHINGSDENIRLDNTGTSNYGLEIWRGGNKGASIAWGEGNANLEIKNYRNDSQADGPYANIDFFTGGTNANASGSPAYSPDLRMRIQQTGEVGIGTTNPVQKLQVAGNAFIGANGTPVNNSLYASNLDFLQVGKGIIFQAGTDSQGFFKSNHYWNGSGHGFLDTSHGSTTIRFNENNDGILQFETAPSGGVSTTPRLTIRNNGNVGIGTTNPGYKLSVDNGTSDGGIFKIHNEEVGLNVSVNGGVGDYTNSTRMVVFNATRFDSGVSPKLRLGGQGGIEFAADANSVRMVVGSNGNIGIGNSDPTDKLTMTVGNGGGILQSTYYSGTATSGQKLGVIGFKGYSQGNTVAGADAKIEAVAAGNHSGSSAPANLDFYTKPESIGPGSAAILRHRIHEEGHQTIYKGTNNWSVQRHSQSSGCFVCHRLYGASSSTTTYNLLRYRRHYWGSGSVKFTLSQTYYSSTSEGEYWLTGHGRSDGSYTPNYSISYVDVYNGPGTRLFTNMPGGAPGNSDAEIVDVSISIPAYYYYMVRVEVSHSEYYTTTSTMGSVNSFALFT